MRAQSVARARRAHVCAAALEWPSEAYDGPGPAGRHSHRGGVLPCTPCVPYGTMHAAPHHAVQHRTALRDRPTALPTWMKLRGSDATNESVDRNWSATDWRFLRASERRPRNAVGAFGGT